jgi:hypothetical protein
MHPPGTAFKQEYHLSHSFDSGPRGRSIAAAISALWLASATLHAQSGLQVVTPETGAVLHAGEVLTVTVEAPPAAFQSVSIAGDGPFALSTPLAAPPYRYSYPIPADLAAGCYRFKAAGVTASGETVYSDPIEVDIERPDKPRKLQSEWQSLTMGDREKTTLQIWAVFADGSKIDVTRSTQTAYTSDRPEVTVVSSEGAVTAAGPGKAKITVRYGDKTLVVPVVITPAPPGG